MERRSNQTSRAKKATSWAQLQVWLAAGFLSLAVGFGVYHCCFKDETSARIPEEQIRMAGSQRRERSTLGGDGRGGQLSFTHGLENQWFEKMRARLLHAQSETDPVKRRDTLRACVDDLTPEMAASILAMMDASDLGGLAAACLFDHWLMAKPANAAAWAQSLRGVAAMPSFMNQVALRWAVSDLKEAVAWVQSLPPGNLQNDLIGTIGAEAVRSNPVEALRLAALLPEESVQADLVCRASAEWAASEPAGAKEWANQITDESLRERAMQGVALSYAAKDPAAAVSMLLENTVEGPEQDQVIVSIVQSWTEKDPLVVSSWVKQFPDDRLGKDAVTNMIQIWASKDVQAAADWLLTLPAGQMKKEGMLAYARVIRRTDAALANHWESRVAENQ